MNNITSQEQASLAQGQDVDDEKFLCVEVTEQKRFQLPARNLTIAAWLIGALVAYEVIEWIMFFWAGLGLTGIIVCSAITLLVTYAIADPILKRLFRMPSVGDPNRIEGWVFSESMILRQFSRYTESYPVAAISHVEERTGSVAFIYSCGASDEVYRSEVDSDEDWAFILKTLKAKHADYTKAFDTTPSVSEKELSISAPYSADEERAYRRLSAPGSLPLWKCLLYDLRNQGLCVIALIVLLHHPGEALSVSDAICLSVAQLFQMSFSGQCKTIGWLAARFAKAGRTRYWSLSDEGLRASEVLGVVKRGLGSSYKQITRYWTDLSSIEQIAEGLVFRFEGSPETTLIPRASTSLQQWDLLMNRLSQLGLRVSTK